MDWKLTAWAVLSLAAFPAEARLAAPASGQVIIRFRHPYAICAGVCPQFQLEISASGDVVRGSPEPTGRHQFRSNTAVRFHVLPAKLKQFRYELDPLRPHGARALDSTCDQAKHQDGSRDPLSMARPDDIEVRWVDARGTDRLTSCAYGRLKAELQSALRRLGVDPYSGKPLAL
jgi:hypothetical protein